MGRGGEGASSGGGETQFAMPTMGGAEAQAPAAAAPTQAPPPDTEDLEPPKPKSKLPLVAALVLLIGGGGGVCSLRIQTRARPPRGEKLAADQAEVTANGCL